MKITGMSPKVGFFLIARQSSKPSIQLIITSSRITSGRSTCMAEMSRRPFAAWPTSKPSSSRASVSISRVSRSSSTMMTLGLRGRCSSVEVTTEISRSVGGAAAVDALPAPPGLGVEGHRLLLAVGVAHEQLHLPLRLVELPRGLARQPHALGEPLDRLLQRELPG